MKLDIKRTVLVGFAFMAISSFWQMYDAVMPKILTNTFHIEEIASGAIIQFSGSYIWLFLYSAICVALAFVTMSVVRHGDTKIEVKRRLEAFDVED